LRVDLGLVQGRIARIRIGSTRPDVARSLLKGRTRAEVGAAVPLLFSICGRSQAAASELACAAAAGEESPADTLARCSATVVAETVREYAWRTLLDWPREIGEKPTDAAVAAARGSIALRIGAPAGQDAGAIAAAAFGVAADEWLALRSLAELDRWIDAGRTATARFVRRVRDDDAADCGHGGHAEVTVPLLPGQDHAAWIGDLSVACDADPAFSRQPTRQGKPAETGALARLQSDRLIDELAHRSASRAPARFVARLRELALLLSGQATAIVGAQAAPAGGGIAWVENARGLLIHKVCLAADRVVDYRIVAPTEWNFHPHGALALALSDVAAADAADARRRTLRLVHSLDPCVACRVEVDDA
jgi:hypothetical protein